jgi:hypothetical protein
MGMNPGLEAVEYPYLKAIAEEAIDQVGTDESSAARYQNLQSVNSLGMKIELLSRAA